MQPYYQDSACTIYHGDCREILPLLDFQPDLVLTDPPWGVKIKVDNARFAGRNRTGMRCTRDRLQPRRPVVGDDEPFDPSHLLKYTRLILWGGHCFASRLPDSPGWFVWDKRRGIEDMDWSLSDSELAWSNICAGVHTFRHRWMGLVRETESGEHYHPTQKPVALMRWCLEKAKAKSVLDPYAGSGSVAVAAKELGIPCVCIEIDEGYCDTIVQRLRQEVLPFPTQRESISLAKEHR